MLACRVDSTPIHIEREFGQQPHVAVHVYLAATNRMQHRSHSTSNNKSIEIAGRLLIYPLRLLLLLKEPSNSAAMNNMPDVPIQVQVDPNEDTEW